MATSKLCVKWSEFQENALGSLKEAKDSSKFCDVTLVSEDGQNTKAHQIILAASSNVFKSMLTEFQSPNALIFLRGINGKALLSLIEYIYNGEVSVYQEDLEDLLSIAVALQIKGLAKSEKQSGNENNSLKEEGDISSANFGASHKESTTGAIVETTRKNMGHEKKSFVKTRIKETCTFLYNDKLDGSCEVYSNIDKNALKDKVKSLLTKIGSGKHCKYVVMCAINPGQDTVTKMSMLRFTLKDCTSTVLTVTLLPHPAMI